MQKSIERRVSADPNEWAALHQSAEKAEKAESGEGSVGGEGEGLVSAERAQWAERAKRGRYGVRAVFCIVVFLYRARLRRHPGQDGMKRILSP